MSELKPLADLAKDLETKLEGLRHLSGGDINMPCPIDNATVWISADNTIWCDGRCDPEDVETALRYVASELPRLCTEIGRSEFGHEKRCLKCSRYAAALREVSRAIQAAYGHPPLGDEEEGEDWAPVSLVDADPVPDACILEIGGSGEFLFRMGWIALIHGSQGSGKSPLCYIAVVEQVRAGNLVMILDYEMGRPGAKALLIELGLSQGDIAAGVVFFDSPGPASSANRRRMCEAMAAQTAKTGRQLTLAVVDSLTEGMSVEPGVDDNNAGDVMAWFNAVPKWLVKQFGVAVLVIDHSGVSDSPRPSGSHKKREIPQHHIWVKTRTAFSKQHDNGQSDLIVMKDRSGQSVIGKVVAELHTKLGGSFYLSTPGSSMSNVLTLTIPNNSMDDDVLRDLRAAGPAGLAKTQVTQGGGTAAQFRRSALDRLIAGGVVITEKVGRNQMCWAAEFAPSRSPSLSVSSSLS